MSMLIAAALVMLWALSFIVFKVTGALIHLLLLAAVVVIAVRVFGGSSASNDVPQ